jgi:hypothetical protein
MILNSSTVSPLFDFGLGWALAFIGLSIILIILFLVVVLLEGLILQWRNYGSFKRSLAASLGMNIVSSVIGYYAARFVDWQPMSRGWHWSYETDAATLTNWFFKSGSKQLPQIPAILLFLAISWIISLISEGLVLMPRRRLPAEDIWGIVIEANIYSYIFLLGVCVLWLMFPEVPVSFVVFLFEFWWLIAVLLFIGVLKGFLNLRPKIRRTLWLLLLSGGIILSAVASAISEIRRLLSTQSPESQEEMLKDRSPF